jgi:hypothetical protein
MDPTLDPYFYAKLRDAMARNDPMHAIVGPLEHREFVRDFVNTGGMLSAPSMALGIPAYTALKALGLFPQARSPASWDEIFAGYQGLFSGLQDRFSKSAQPTIVATR